MRNGIDPRRRSRNIGTRAQGHGQDNVHVVPESWHQDRVFYEKLVDPRIVVRQLHATEITFLVEPPRGDCAHACTVDDVLEILALLPAEDRLSVTTYVFRQPTRRQHRLASCWGRLAYFASLGRFEGVAIFLDAQVLDKPSRWPRSMTPMTAAELDRLRQDGHDVVKTRRHYEIRSTIETVRSTQLYRTLPHEMGHDAHYRLALEKGIDHWSRTQIEKEQFAHRYADQFIKRARDLKLLPFPRRLSAATLARDGLLPSWFGA